LLRRKQRGDSIGSTATVFRPARVAQPVKPYHTVRAMADRSVVVLKYQGKVPAMASCAKFQRKFFTQLLFIVILSVHRNTCSASLICTIVPRSEEPWAASRVAADRTVKI